MVTLDEVVNFFVKNMHEDGTLAPDVGVAEVDTRGLPEFVVVTFTDTTWMKLHIDLPKSS